MSDFVQWQEALDKGIISVGTHFQVPYPDGRKILWRMERIGEGLVMWGPPTAKKLTLRGKNGYDNLFTLLDRHVENEFALPKIFSSVRACGPRSAVEVKRYTELIQEEEKLRKIYCQHPDDTLIAPYFLAACCVLIDEIYARFYSFYKKYARYYVLYVYGGCVSAKVLYILGGGGECSSSFAIRPEAVPHPSSYIWMDGRDGSKDRPYVLLGSATPNKVELEAIYKEELAGSGKDELWHLLQEGKNLMTEENQKGWLSRLEECVKNSEK